VNYRILINTYILIITNNTLIVINIIAERFVVGQNIASKSSSGENKSTVDSMILSWYNEVKDFNNKWVSSFP
jgi:hypothetical protein